ncbi:hypothetical protein HC891_28310 [Candidatus Gracilibacteria bacterium]|nr:hypothetical protein [Candidatus Gracilibacteria bacterium]
MRSKVANPDKIALSFAVLSLLIFVGIRPVLGIIPDNIGVWAFIALTVMGLVSTVAALLL